MEERARCCCQTPIMPTFLLQWKVLAQHKQKVQVQRTKHHQLDLTGKLRFLKGLIPRSFTLTVSTPEVVNDSKGLPHGWSIHAQFCLAVINRRDARLSVRKDFLEDGSVMVQAYVSVPRVVDCWSPESKKETAFVGLMNQGATCYMNSLLQTLYHIPYFRKAVYHMPTTKNYEPSGNIPLALQSLFYKSQYSDPSVVTKELMESFGWDAHDSFMQHDAQEFSRLLCERIEDKMKGTTLDGTIQQLFEGHQVSHMECINVDYKSSIKEFFYGC